MKRAFQLLLLALAAFFSMATSRQMPPAQSANDAPAVIVEEPAPPPEPVVIIEEPAPPPAPVIIISQPPMNDPRFAQPPP